MLVHTELPHGGRELTLTDRRQARRREPARVDRPVLTPRRGDHHDPVPGAPGEAEQPSGEIGLVVGVREHAHDRPE